MKVNIYETVEITDAQRVDLANVLDQKINKPKRQATRDEIKAYVWENGSSWDGNLRDEVNDLNADAGNEPAPADEPAPAEAEAEDEDLI